MKRALSYLASMIVVSAIAAHAQSTHTVTLAWTQSTSSGVTANNVYRSTISGTQGTVIYTSTSPVTAYTDPGPLANGTTYYYCITALVGSSESVCSSQTSAVIPNPPPAPTGLADTVQ